jgi:hypothetical protein
MNRSIIQKAALSAAFVAGGWLAATVAHGAAPSVDPTVAALQSRVALLESAQAKAGTFTQDGNGNWSFAPSSGNVSITSSKDFNVKAGAGATINAQQGNLDLKAGGSATISSQADAKLTSSAGNLLLSGAASLSARAPVTTVSGDAQMNVRGALLILNGGTKPLIDATAVPAGLCPQMGGPLQGGQLVGGSAPTVLVP